MQRKPPSVRFGNVTANSIQRPMESQPEGYLASPQFARWIDEDELDEHGNEDEESMDEDSESLPSETAVESENQTDQPGLKPQGKARPVWRAKKRKDLSKRTSKHAPTEVTSKRPVTRKRVVVDMKPAPARDPRFLPIAGEFSASRFREQYRFLADIHERELKTVQEHTKRMRNLVKRAPNDRREEWDHEMDKLELAVNRAKSAVDRDKKDKMEQEALAKVAKEEHEKRRIGKKAWWMKKSDKRSFLTRVRYDAIASTGGRSAVRKAIEKKQKKISQKERKSRPPTRRLVRDLPTPSLSGHDQVERKGRRKVD